MLQLMAEERGAKASDMDDRYCIDISNQLLAVESIIGKANKEVIRGHMYHCVKEAFESGDEEKKIDEIISLIDKMSKR